MAKVVAREGERLESLLRRFKKKVDKENLMKEMRRHDFYLSKSEKRRIKSKEARQRILKEERKRAMIEVKKLERDENIKYTKDRSFSPDQTHPRYVK